MTVTAKLVRVYEVDRKLRGLRSRLRAAERFLTEQTRALSELETRKGAIEGQIRQLTASTSNDEGEIERVDARIEELRDRMNNAQTNKEYKALLTEVNTLKEHKTSGEETALGRMEQLETLRTELDTLQSQHAERVRMRDVAQTERDEREGEIRERLEALESERGEVVSDVPDGVLRVYEELLEQRDDEAMAPIEIMDRKRHEFSCGSCMVMLPVESMSALLSHGSLTLCVNCGCILYVEEKAREAMAAKK